MRLLAALMMVFLVFDAASGAEVGGTTDTKKENKRFIYEWTDAEGGIHITDDLGEVPERYRAGVRAREMPKDPEAGPQQRKTTEYAPRAATGAEEASSKAAWQSKLRSWKARLANAQQRYSDLDRRRLEALGRWGGPASGHREGRAEAERIEAEMKTVQKEIDEARDMIEKVIPEEARKAGIPPGWLRE